MIVNYGDEYFQFGEVNRARALATRHVEQIVMARLVHGTDVREVGRQDAGTIIDNVDALVTKESNLFLGLTVADCLPIFFSDELAGVIGLAHAGWRGITSGIVEKTVAKLFSLGAKPETLHVTIGPGIHQDHFVVRDDVIDRFAPWSTAIQKIEQGYHVDLYAIVRQQLLGAHIPNDHITLSDECTFDLPQKYFSYRRDKPSRTETMLAFIGRPA